MGPSIWTCKSEVSTNTNSAFNNFTQTSRLSENIMGAKTFPPLNNTTQSLPSQYRSRGINTNMGDNSFTQTMQPEHAKMVANTSNNATSQDKVWDITKVCGTFTI